MNDTVSRAIKSEKRTRWSEIAGWKRQKQSELCGWRRKKEEWKKNNKINQQREMAKTKNKMSNFSTRKTRARMSLSVCETNRMRDR